MNFIESEAFKKYRLFLVYSGMWPYDDSMTKWIKRGLCSVNLILFLLLQIISTFTSEAIFDMLIDLVPVMFMELLIIQKVHFCWIKENGYKNCFDHMRVDWTRLKKNEVPLLKRSQEECLFYYKLLFVVLYAPSISFMIFQFTPKITDVDVPWNKSRRNDFILPIEYFVDPDKYFYPIIMHMSLTGLLLSTAMCTVDFLNLIIELHMLAMFNLLGYLIERLFDKPEDNKNKIGLNTVYHRRLVYVVDLHKRNLKLGNTFERCIVESSILQAILGILCITSMLFKLKKIVSPMEDVRAVISHCAILGACMSSAYLILFMLEKVNDSSSDMFMKLYFGRWYAAPIESQKLLLFIMLRCTKPYRFQVKNLIIASTETFASMVQAGFSYFMVLYSLD